MSPRTDSDFVDQLRAMAATTPVIAVPGAATIVRAGRSRVARRRSVYAGAFGVVLMAGAGFTALAQPANLLSAEHSAADAAVAYEQPLYPPAPRLEGGAEAPDAAGPEAAIAPTDIEISPHDEVADETRSVAEAPVGSDSSITDDAELPLDAVATDTDVEAASSQRASGLSPLAASLGAAGVASLAAATGLAIRSRKLQPAVARVPRG